MDGVGPFFQGICASFCFGGASLRLDCPLFNVFRPSLGSDGTLLCAADALLGSFELFFRILQRGVEFSLQLVGASLRGSELLAGAIDKLQGPCEVTF